MPKRLNGSNLSRGMSYLKRNGLKASYYKAMERLARDRNEASYRDEFLANVPSEEELQRQREYVFAHPYRISIIIPAYETDPVVLNKLLASIARQTYSNWEICIADGSSSDVVKKCVKEFTDTWALRSRVRNTAIDFRSKVKYRKLLKNGGISENTNEALSMATGLFVGLADHDDVLTEDALFNVMKFLSGEEAFFASGSAPSCPIRMVYSDEDKISEDDKELFDFHKKPDFDPFLLRTNNYICHFLVVETALAREIGGFRSEYDGAQDYDFILRLTEQLKEEEIAHISRVVYHWRSLSSSTAEHPESKMYAYEAGLRAVKDHLLRIKISGEVSHTEHLGFYEVHYSSPTFTFKKMLPDEYNSLTPKGLSSIKEDYILVVSPELKAMSDDFIMEWASVLCRENVGAVCGRIINKGGKTESAGYDVKSDGVWSPRFEGLPMHYSGYMHRAELMQYVGAPAPDAKMVRTASIVFENGGPMISPKFHVVYNPFVVFRRM